MKWKVRIALYPYFRIDGDGKKRIGDSPKAFAFEAQTFSEAVKAVDLICQGLNANPAVRECSVECLEKIGE